MRILATAIMAVVIGSTGTGVLAQNEAQRELGCAIVIGELINRSENTPKKVQDLFDYYVGQTMDNFDVSRDEALDTMLDFSEEVGALTDEQLLSIGVPCAKIYAMEGEPNV